MSLYVYGQKWGIVAANLVRKLWASATAPASPATDEVYIDKAATQRFITQYNGAAWVKVSPSQALEATDGPTFDHLHLTGIIAQEAWTAPTLLNSWVNFGGGYSIAGYFKDKNGIVHLRGLVKTGTIGADIFVLPVGYRPGYVAVFPVASTAYGECYVFTDGKVNPAIGSNTYFSLNGIAFRAV